MREDGRMALQIDKTRALRTHDDLRALIGAIVAALAEDEPDWLEWKSTLDLNDKIAQGRIARTILGMANRPVVTALRAMEGYSYIVVGAEPGAAAGITRIDPSELGRGIQPYLGAAGPAWHLDYILYTGSGSVLVVTVDPPRPGDRIRTLDKESERHLRGTVLIRRPGETAQADPGEVRALEDRLMTPNLANHRRERLEKIAAALDAAFDVVKTAQPSDRHPVIWTTQRNRLEEALGDWDGPEMVSVLNFVRAGTAYQALMLYPAARGDIAQQFLALKQEQQTSGTS